MQFTTRRLTGQPPKLVGRSPEDYAEELQEFLEHLVAQTVGGIPPGFNNLTPSVIDANSTASAGSESAGWMAADATFDLDTTSGTEVDVSFTAATSSGTGPGVSLLGHTHQVHADDVQDILANQVYGD